MVNFDDDRKHCIIMNTVTDKFSLQLLPCDLYPEGQLFFLTANGEIRRDNFCLDYSLERNMVLPFKCRGDKESQVC